MLDDLLLRARLIAAVLCAVLAACSAPQTAPTDGAAPDLAANLAPDLVLSADQPAIAMLDARWGARFDPTEHGWYVTIFALDDPSADLSCITPPRMAPNPRDLAGWHLRNASNTGPNAPGEDNVNAPGTSRDILFATPAYLADPGTTCALGPEPVPDGALGTLHIELVDVELTPPAPGERAAIVHTGVRLSLDPPL